MERVRGFQLRLVRMNRRRQTRSVMGIPWIGGLTSETRIGIAPYVDARLRRAALRVPSGTSQLLRTIDFDLPPPYP